MIKKCPCCPEARQSYSNARAEDGIEDIHPQLYFIEIPEETGNNSVDGGLTIDK
jgi:hypothetical protein